jgi:hypothetical protein
VTRVRCCASFPAPRSISKDFESILAVVVQTRPLVLVAWFVGSCAGRTGRDDFAQIVTQDLERERVSTQLVITEKKEQTGASIILVGAQGSRTVLVHRGAASNSTPLIFRRIGCHKLGGSTYPVLGAGKRLSKRSSC